LSRSSENGSKGHRSKRIDENMIIRLNSSKGSNIIYAYAACSCA
jgi:hypothetical protein